MSRGEFQLGMGLTPDLRESQRSLYAQALLSFPVYLVFLVLGSGLFYFLQQQVDVDASIPSGYVLPYFVKTFLPQSLRVIFLLGLLSSATASLDSAVGAIASVMTVHIIKPLSDKDRDPSSLLRDSRISMAATGAALLLVALGIHALGDDPEVLILALTISSIPHGALLGVFLAGLLTRSRGSTIGNSLAITTAMCLLILGWKYKALLIFWGQDPATLEKWPDIAWSHFIVGSTLVSFLVACCFRTKRKTPHPDRAGVTAALDGGSTSQQS